MIIAVVAVFHVFIAHFAVGAGVFNAITETLAVRGNRPVLLRFVAANSKFLILFAFIAGAVSGVGIWFTTAVVSPRAISLLVHNFIWAWAIEWTVFLVEIISGYVYYYTWRRLSPKRHIAVGWIYAASAWLSLFVINGIITFMLSPGGGLELRDGQTPVFHFWSAMFNPTFWPSLLLRTVSALALAGIFACVAVNLGKNWSREERTEVINYASWFLLPLGLMAPLAYWYFQCVPDESRHLVFGGAVAMNLFFMFGVAASLMVAFYAYWGLIRQKRYVNLETSLTLALTALVATGSMEFVREGIRKPWLVPGYLYSNGLSIRDVEAYNATGMFDTDDSGNLRYPHWIENGWRPAEASSLQTGALIYQAQCAGCHTPSGVNDLAPLIANWDRDKDLSDFVRRQHHRKPFMPPFAGSDQDLENLLDFLIELRNGEAADHARPASG